MKTNLSDIPGWRRMSLEQIQNWCLDNGIITIVNDYGFGLEFELDDLEHIWNELKTKIGVWVKLPLT